MKMQHGCSTELRISAGCKTGIAVRTIPHVARFAELGALCLWLSVFAASRSSAEERLFPPDGGMINVQLPPYNARGDGLTDDTAAIQAAIRFAIDRTVVTTMKPSLYFPTGTYLVSKTLESRLATRTATRLVGGMECFYLAKTRRTLLSA
jgi:hypothetical protein